MTGTALDIPELLRSNAGNWTLDPAGSSAEFHVKHFWGAITVHGRFERIEGEGIVGTDGTATGSLRLDAASLTTKMKKRDQHLRSAEFFDVERHPNVTVSVDRLAATSDGHLTARVHLEAAGHIQTITPTVQVVQADTGAVTLRGEVVVDRTTFAMTWSPLGMASRHARGVVTARFVRA